MKILDGNLLSNKIKDEVKSVSDSYHQTPILAVISIGNNSESELFIKKKREACEYIGISMMHFHYNENEKEEKIIKKIKELNKDKSVNGIIIELPIPDNFNQNKLINTISASKDVDGLTEINLGKLISNSDCFIPSTVKGIMELLDYYNISLEGKHVVIIGRSLLIGKPLMIECLKRNATISVCNSKTKKISDYTKNADVIISCSGKKFIIDNTMIKKDAIIVDVGICYEDKKVYGDVNPNVKSLASYLTPVPGGIGPMSVCMLLKNTIIAYQNQNDKKEDDSVIKLK